MSEDRPTRLSVQLARKIRRDCPELKLLVAGDNLAVIQRIRFRSDDDEAWLLSVEVMGKKVEFSSSYPASELVKKKLQAKFVQSLGRYVINPIQ